MSSNLFPHDERLGRLSPIPLEDLPNASQSQRGPSRYNPYDSETSYPQTDLQSDDASEIKEPAPVNTKRGWRFYGAFGTLCLVTFIIALDSTIICVALPVGALVFVVASPSRH